MHDLFYYRLTKNKLSKHIYCIKRKLADVELDLCWSFSPPLFFPVDSPHIYL